MWFTLTRSDLATLLLHVMPWRDMICDVIYIYVSIYPTLSYMTHAIIQ